jgi:hypothetical protein
MVNSIKLCIRWYKFLLASRNPVPAFWAAINGVLDKAFYTEQEDEHHFLFQHTGAWSTEPDYVFWWDKTTGFPCIIRRVPGSGHFCGYVGCLVEKASFEQDLDPHGGITWGGPLLPWNETVEGIVYWLGFDCAHAGDYLPCFKDGGGEYRGVEYCIQECQYLAKSIVQYYHVHWIVKLLFV